MSIPPTTPPILQSQPRLRARPAPLMSRPFDDSVGGLTILSPQKKSPIPVPLTIHQLLLLPPSPVGPKFHHVAEESPNHLPSEATPRRKGKNRSIASVISPRNGTRRARKRLEKEIWKDEKEVGPVEDEAKARKRRPSRPRSARKEKTILMPHLPSSSQIPKPELIAADGQSRLDGILKAISDLLMWKNVAKSTLWFGLGSSLILSSIFSREFSFSIISGASHLAILMLVLAFFCNSFTQRNLNRNKAIGIQLTEEKIFRVSRVILPLLNAALGKIQEIFSGEPLMTLKMCPALFFMATYGHLLTLWRLVAIGFFLSFTAPKLYSCYCQQIQQTVEDSRNYVFDSWRSCSRKKLIATLAAALLWNMFSVRMRIYAAFISVVIFRCHHQKIFAGKHAEEAVDNGSIDGDQYQQHVEDEQRQ